VVLLITGVLGSILMPAINIMMTIASFVFGIDPNLLMTLGS
jgi:hypothetical protein